MAIALATLVEEADRYLNAARISDYCPNGLQVEGRPQVRRIVSGVTASQALIEAAVEADADVLLVHHGYFWKGENPCITGMKRRRLQTLLVEGDEMIRRVGWCTGGGQGYIDQAIAAGVDLYLTGEASEQTFHSARENCISFIAASH